MALEDEQLVAFVAGRDVACPGCGYSLRDLQGSVCPECGEGLVLRVGVAEPRLGAYLTGLVGIAMGLGFNLVISVMIGLIFWTEGGKFYWWEAEMLIPIVGLAVLGVMTCVWVTRWFRRVLRRWSGLKRWGVVLGSWVLAASFPMWLFVMLW